MKNSIHSTILAATFSAALAGLGGAAHAADTGAEAHTMAALNSAEQIVNYEDLDLTSGPGREALAQRINRAAQAVCGSTDHRQAGGLRAASRNRDCTREARDEAMARVENNTALAARH